MRRPRVDLLWPDCCCYAYMVCTRSIASELLGLRCAEVGTLPCAMPPNKTRPGNPKCACGGGLTALSPDQQQLWAVPPSKRTRPHSRVLRADSGQALTRAPNARSNARPNARPSCALVILEDFQHPKRVPGPSHMVQGGTREAPRRHRGGTREAPGRHRVGTRERFAHRHGP